MRWRMGRRSAQIEDRRGAGRGLRLGGAGGLGIIALALVAMFLGVDPSLILNMVSDGGSGGSVAPRQGAPPPQDEAASFVSAVLAQTEDTWQGIFARHGDRYAPPQLVLFDGSVRSACGTADAATGPFYCPGDRKIYLDLAFFDELAQRFGAPGDFARAYVIAHEVGHHVQTLLGTAQQAGRMRSQAGETEANRLSVMLELQADCFAGLWARRVEAMQAVLEPGDIEEGLAAASAVGDDRIQAAGRGEVVPDSFTHGSSEQRMRWFRRGLEAGEIAACDTFGAGRL